MYKGPDVKNENETEGDAWGTVKFLCHLYSSIMEGSPWFLAVNKWISGHFFSFLFFFFLFEVNFVIH